MGGNYFGLNAIKHLGTNGLYSTQRINSNPYMNFGQSGIDQDSFSYQQNSINRFTSKASIQQAIQQNPKIREILKAHGISAEINMENLRHLLATHAKDTQKISPCSHSYKSSLPTREGCFVFKIKFQNPYK